MKILKKATLVLAALCLFSAIVFGDTKAKVREDRGTEHPSPNPAVVVVRSAAKGTWAVTKFSTQHLAKPVAKKVLLKATPAASKFVLKLAAKNALPLVAKLAVL